MIGTKHEVAEETATAPRWLRLARSAAITMVVWSVVLQATARMVIPPVAVIGAVFLVFSLFLAGERRWLGLAVSAFSAVAVAGNLPIIVDELQHPDSTPAFILTLLSVVGAALAFVAGLGAFLRRPVSPVRALVMAAVGVFIAGSAWSVAAGANAPTDDPLAGDVPVLAVGVEWDPVDITVGGGATGVWVDNRDGIRHTFTAPELGIDLEIAALKARRVDIEAAPGAYVIFCTVPGHEDMTGTLVIEN